MAEKNKKNSKNEKIKISKEMTLAEAVSRFPETIEVFLEHGMGCFGCGIAQFETIEQGAVAHGIDVKKLMNDLEKVVKKKK